MAACAVLAGAWVTARQVAPAEDPCTQVDQAMRDAWGPTQREALERAFRQDATTYSEQSIERVEHALEVYADRWVDERRAACEAGREVGTEAARDAGLSAACLDEHLRRFEVLVRLFGDADQQMVAKAVSAVQELPEPGRCRDGARYRQAVPLPDKPEQQERVESLRMKAAELQALALTGHIKEADEQLVVYLPDHRGVGRSARLGCPEQEAAGSDEGLRITIDEWPACMESLQEIFGEALPYFDTTSASTDLGWLIEQLPP